MIELSLSAARRLALTSQGFGPRPARVSVAHIRKLAARLNAFQIDSVNVLARAHYVPAFARLGPYPMEMLDALAYGKRELFEYWGHAACLLPTSLHPLLRYRMDRHREPTEEYLKSPRGAYLASVLAEVGERGPMGAGDLSEPGERSSRWWGWGRGKSALEYLFNAGYLAIAGRRGFERLYDLADRVIPRAILEVPAVPREEAMKRLICLGAKACGIGTLDDVAGYLEVDGWRDRLPAGPWWERAKGPERRRAKPILGRLMAELVEERRLWPAKVEGWREGAYLHPDARVPRRVACRAIVTPFDSLVWDRRRIARLFGMKYTIEMYTPAARRVFGYYVCPFLLGDTLVARCDLKADRERRVLMVQSAFTEPGADARRAAPELARELREMQAWLRLERIEVANRGDLAPKLRRCVG
jgi:uncharacterized protein